MKTPQWSLLKMQQTSCHLWVCDSWCPDASCWICVSQLLDIMQRTRIRIYLPCILVNTHLQIHTWVYTPIQKAYKRWPYTPVCSQCCCLQSNQWMQKCQHSGQGGLVAFFEVASPGCASTTAAGFGLDAPIASKMFSSPDIGIILGCVLGGLAFIIFMWLISHRMWEFSLAWYCPWMLILVSSERTRAKMCMPCILAHREIIFIITL